MSKNISLTIGIPAYNEESNIAFLIGDILGQTCEGFNIAEIIISCDGCTDRTVNIVKSISDPRIKLLANPTRRGIARGLNQITTNTTSDILVTLDSDTRILDQTFIKKLILPIVESRADLTSGSITPFPPTSTTSHILQVSMRLKEVLFAEFKKGHNLYTCHGLARGYSRRFYQNLRFPVSVGNDMYSYLACLSQGFDYSYVPKAVIWYRLPETFADHRRQSQRFFVSDIHQNRYFSPKLVAAQTHIPFSIYLKAALKAFPLLLEYPLHSTAYFCIQLYLRYFPSQQSVSQAWDMANSSKKL